jgi:hypothetical protein
MQRKLPACLRELAGEGHTLMSGHESALQAGQSNRKHVDYYAHHYEQMRQNPKHGL